MGKCDEIKKISFKQGISGYTIDSNSESTWRISGWNIGKRNGIIRFTFKDSFAFSCYVQNLNFSQCYLTNFEIVSLHKYSYLETWNYHQLYFSVKLFFQCSVFPFLFLLFFYCFFFSFLFLFILTVLYTFSPIC